MTDGVPEGERRRPGRPRHDGPTPEYLERLDDIVDTAARVFGEKGYDTGSLEDVAAELDLRKASLYYYVNSKAHLLYLIFDRAISLALARLEDLTGIDDPRDRLTAMITHQVALVTHEPSLFSVFFDHRPRLDEAYEKEIRTKERRYVRIYADAVAAAVDAGVLPDMHRRYGAHAVLGMTSWVYKWFRPKQDDIVQVALTCARMVLGDDVDAELVKRLATER